MKTTTKITALIVLTILLSFSCKKKKSDPPPASPAPSNNPSVHVNAFTAKINGQSWSVGTNTAVGAFINTGYTSGPTKIWDITGLADLTSNKNSIFLRFPYTVGTFTFQGNSWGTYHDANGTYCSIKTGTINISLMDTSHTRSNIFDKLKATFSFTTDSVNGTNYTVTEGNIDYEYQ